MFKVGDYVKVVKGLHNGSEGIVVKISKNDMGTITYEIHVEKLFKRIGNISKREGEIEMAKRGRPVKNASKIEELKEVTKQVVEMTEAEPTAAVDNPVETVDEPVEVVDELFDEAVEEPIEPKTEIPIPYGVEPKTEDDKSSLTKLLENYEEICKTLSVPELELFCDRVTKDLELAKLVLEKMYQLPIEKLAKIRKEIA